MGTTMIVPGRCGNRACGLRQRLGKTLRDDSGIALAMAVGLMMVLAIAVVAILELSASNSRSAEAEQAEDSAFAIAEAGLHTAISKASTDPGNTAAVPYQSEPVEGGTTAFSGTYDPATSSWTFTASGTVANPAAGAPITRTVSTKTRVIATAVSTPNDEIWRYVFSDAAGCMNLSHNSGTTVFSAPLYVRGDLCLSKHVHLTGSPVEVVGTITLADQSSVGNLGEPIAEAKLGACMPAPHPCTVADKVYADSITQGTSGLVKPTVNLPFWWQNAAPGPKKSCGTGSTGTAPAFDNDAGSTVAPNGSLPTPVNLTPAAAYNCRFTDAQGNLLGRIAWTPGSPGTLDIQGTVYFDGDIAQSGNAVYRGRGTIYATGQINFTNGAKLCVVAACNATWDATQNMLLMVSGSSLMQPAGYGIELDNNAQYQGAFYAVGDYHQNNNAETWVSAVAHQVYIDNSSETYSVPMGALLAGSPSTAPPLLRLEPLDDEYRG
jgi:Tfp pilus assembly protein PilX